MTSRFQSSLSLQFPRLDFVKDADGWLSLIHPAGQTRKSLAIQFRERRISQLRILPLLFPGGLDIGPDGNFRISLNDMNTAEDDVDALGHEFGHTFHYDLSKNQLLCKMPRDISDDLFDLVERFCDAFSEKWIEINGRALIMAYARK